MIKDKKQAERLRKELEQFIGESNEATAIDITISKSIGYSLELSPKPTASQRTFHHVEKVALFTMAHNLHVYVSYDENRKSIYCSIF